jgi:dTDP-4-dehydrorhamnose 3,5-epimerase
VIEVEDLKLGGAKIVRTRRFADARGWFSETFSERWRALADIAAPFVQDNLSWSEKAGTLRGLHAQRAPMAQAKLVSVAAGAIFDVIIDCRQGSPSFGRHRTIDLSAGVPSLLYVPAGFCHGFLTTEPGTMVSYKVANFYSQEHETGIRWNDPTLAIDWPLCGRQPIVSAKDAVLPLLADFVPL